MCNFVIPSSFYFRATNELRSHMRCVPLHVPWQGYMQIWRWMTGKIHHRLLCWLKWGWNWLFCDNLTSFCCIWSKQRWYIYRIQTLCIIRARVTSLPFPRPLSLHMHMSYQSVILLRFHWLVPIIILICKQVALPGRWPPGDLKNSNFHISASNYHWLTLYSFKCNLGSWQIAGK